MLASLLAAFASGETQRLARQVRRAAIVYALVGIAATVAIGFLVAAAYMAAANRYGAINAALAFAGGFFLFAVLLLLVHWIMSRMRARAVARQRSSDLATIAAASALAALPTLVNKKGGIAALVAPALALTAYAIYRENRKAKPDDKDLAS
jgi:Na+-transporting methylmalonyl-CoA/oxaloacetate decarboxylase gamma subunit